MTPDAITQALTNEGFTVLDIDASPGRREYAVAIVPVGYEQATMTRRCNKAGLRLHQYGRIGGVQYMIVSPVKREGQS